MKQTCDVAIIGAGPHGLSLAAHLKARGINMRIFGTPMSTWAEHMPKGMMLKSDGFASNLSAPSPDSTLKAYCARNRLLYADQALPIPLDTFLQYANWFQTRYVSELEQTDVAALVADGDGFALTLADGERVRARNVVMAIGISWFNYTPPVLSKLSAATCSHSAQHRYGDEFKGREVAIIGAGASAINLAELLHDVGASVRVIAKSDAIEYNNVPDAANETLLGRIQRPASGIGRGWRSLFCAEAPLLFYRLPHSLKRRAINSHMHPAAGWYMRDKIEASNIAMSLGRSLVKAEESRERVTLTLADKSGAQETQTFDHVVAATGYRTDMTKVPFLSSDLCARVAPTGEIPALSDSFETPVPGLFMVGPGAIDSFGPLMRFMIGAEFAAPRVAGRLDRILSTQSSQRAA